MSLFKNHVKINHCGETGPCITETLILKISLNGSVKIYSKHGSLTHYSGYRKIQFSRWVMPDSLQPHGLQHNRPLCPSPTPRACSNSCPLNQWCHSTSSSGVPFFSHLQSCPASESFLMSQFFTSGGWSIGVSASASVLPMNIQNWFPLGLTGWISLED